MDLRRAMEKGKALIEDDVTTLEQGWFILYRLSTQLNLAATKDSRMF